MVIWKYDLYERKSLELPFNHKVLSVQVQNDVIYVWIMLDETQPFTYKRDFMIIATGELVNPVWDYVGTVQLYNGLYVYHVFTD